MKSTKPWLCADICIHEINLSLDCALTLEGIVNVHNFVGLRCMFKKVDNIWLTRVHLIEMFVASQLIRCFRNAVQFRRVVHERTKTNCLPDFTGGCLSLHSKNITNTDLLLHFTLNIIIFIDRDERTSVKTWNLELGNFGLFEFLSI